MKGSEERKYSLTPVKYANPVQTIEKVPSKFKYVMKLQGLNQRLRDHLKMLNG
jgi:hypothetical protein